ncbi:Copper radical oxidase [Rhizoctonia solani]|uniref:Copper radical oxidase n=1 Tax=Rhizoctonia solani TaxID=456999 RepID=A0A8H7IDL6_9AGAM|nr:Copper radical oxidase [Rhizoctonia solani]
MFDSIASAALVALLAVPARAQWTLTLGGTTGVSAMQMTVATETNVVVIDKYEQNPLRDASGDHSLGSIYSTDSNTVRPLNIKTTVFALPDVAEQRDLRLQAGGGDLSLFRLGELVSQLAAQVFYHRRSVRPAAFLDHLYLSWLKSYPAHPTYVLPLVPSSCRLSDGSAIIVGGAYGGGWTNFDALNNPTYEFYPPKNINGFNVFARHFTAQHVSSCYSIADNQLFMAANSKAMKFNWETNTETRLPDLPNKQITVYPMSAPAVLLPLTWENNYKPEVVIFGGSQLADTVKENEVSSQSPTSKQASRIALDAAGIANGWSYDEMPEGRVMADATILPDGKVLIMNGAKTGTAGYGNVPDQIGQSNADNPAFTPVLYDPAAPAGSRFSSAGMPTSNIARLYHSVSTLLPDGRVMIAGSNPNADVETRPYKTEYQVEYISPPYMTKTRPTYTGLPAAWNYGQNITLSVTLPASLNPPSITVSLMDLGFSTHGVHMDMRMIKLKATLSSNRKSLVITGPPNASSALSPGPAWVYVLSNGVPSKAQKVLIGTGASPPVNQGAIDNMLALTGGP